MALNWADNRPRRLTRSWGYWVDEGRTVKEEAGDGVSGSDLSRWKSGMKPRTD